jgi:MscS family membrane protein
MTTSMKPIRCCATAMLAALLINLASAASAADDNPLRPPDASSPRATLQGFIAAMDDIYRRMGVLLANYADSNRLYLSRGERRDQLAALREAPKVLRYLDLSGIPPVLKDTVSIERAIQLKEILDRIEVPPFADIPDQGAMAQSSAKRWRLPNTEIDIARIENGPQAGNYLVTADTIEHLPEYYALVKGLPYKPGPAQQLDVTYRKLAHSETATIYDAFESSPIGLSFIIPPRWMLSLPEWAKVRVADTAAWQWFGLTIGLLIGGLMVWIAHRIARQHLSDGEAEPRPHWQALLLPIVIIIVAGFLTPLLDVVLRTAGNVRIVIEYARTGAAFLAAAWLAMVAFAILGEAVVGAERLTIRSLDSQLIRLGSRLVGLVVATTILVYGGDELGFPAYSVLAGLGVGGLAVALAAQSTVANLIGSLLLVLEKPFRVGQSVRIGTSEGTVVDVGFRSTRIRTPEHTLLSIPSSSVVNATVENLSVRATRRQRLVIQVAYDTSRHQLDELIGNIRQLLADNPMVEPSGCQVRFNNFAEASLDILVVFYLVVEDYGAELAAREAVLLQIMDAVKQAGVVFAGG